MERLAIAFSSISFLSLSLSLRGPFFALLFPLLRSRRIHRGPIVDPFTPRIHGSGGFHERGPFHLYTYGREARLAGTPGTAIVARFTARNEAISGGGDCTNYVRSEVIAVVGDIASL